MSSKEEDNSSGLFPVKGQWWPGFSSWIRAQIQFSSLSLVTVKTTILPYAGRPSSVLSFYLYSASRPPETVQVQHTFEKCRLLRDGAVNSVF